MLRLEGTVQWYFCRPGSGGGGNSIFDTDCKRLRISESRNWEYFGYNPRKTQTWEDFAYVQANDAWDINLVTVLPVAHLCHSRCGSDCVFSAGARVHCVSAILQDRECGWRYCFDYSSFRNW